MERTSTMVEATLRGLKSAASRNGGHQEENLSPLSRHRNSNNTSRSSWLSIGPGGMHGAEFRTLIDEVRRLIARSSSPTYANHARSLLMVPENMSGEGL
jgi:hypothetical protein